MSAPSQCKSEVARYFEKENRPFSLMDVANALRNHGKTALAKAVDELVEEEYLKEKVYGKQKVYVYDQSKLPVFDEDELKLLDSEITTLSHELSGKQQHLRSLNLELKRISSSLTKEEAERKLMETEVELKRVKSEIERLKNKGPAVSAEEFEKATASLNLLVSEWRKRKRIAIEIVDTVAEGYPKSKKQLIVSYHLLVAVAVVLNQTYPPRLFTYLDVFYREILNYVSLDVIIKITNGVENERTELLSPWKSKAYI
ncbi:hypothetical protein P879_10246 [Paragonimus westermani]|uniref:Homologous-pairing protein 2 winged helix domain-containing protein n=1 Tax=Paragonimus westermani TaxID=34504 RepID=A0A8T0DB15_9TREM|nr:hypothetical protein P879_10246 [Paragonimus westermani]